MSFEEQKSELNKLREEKENFLKLIRSLDRRVDTGEITSHQRNFTISSIAQGLSENEYLRMLDLKIGEQERINKNKKVNNPALKNISIISAAVLITIILIAALIVPELNKKNSTRNKEFIIPINATYYGTDTNIYNLNISSDTKITSLKINGSYYGDVKIYLVSNKTKEKYIVFDSKKYDTNIISITGNLFVIKGDPGEKGVRITGICDETCKLQIAPEETYLEIIVGDTGFINIGEITYSQAVINHAPVQIEQIPDIIINGDYFDIDISKYITDIDGDNLTYALSKISEIEIITENNIITFESSKKTDGRYSVFLYISDGIETMNSNAFRIVINRTTEGAIEYNITKNKPKWYNASLIDPNDNLPFIKTNRTIDENTSLTNRTTTDNVSKSNRTIDIEYNSTNGKIEYLWTLSNMRFKVDPRLVKVWDQNPSSEPRVLIKYNTKNSLSTSEQLSELKKDLEIKKNNGLQKFSSQDLSQEKEKLIQKIKELESQGNIRKDSGTLLTGNIILESVETDIEETILNIISLNEEEYSDNTKLDLLYMQLEIIETQINTTEEYKIISNTTLVVEDIDKNASIEVIRSNLSEIQILKDNLQIEGIYLDEPVEILMLESIELTRIPQAKLYPENILEGVNETICLLDTGVDSTIVKNTIYGYNFIDDNDNFSDDNGHGTSIGYIIYSIAPKSKIIPVKVIDTSGQGYESTVLSGLEYCYNHNATIISLSIGSSGYIGYCNNNPVAQKIDELSNLGIISIAASGNDASNNVKSPACAKSAIAVGASTKNDSIAEFTTYNGNTILVAPGVAIETIGLENNEIFGYGTSYSVPFVTAITALINSDSSYSNNESLSVVETKDLLIHTGQLINYGNKTFSRIDAYNAISRNITNNLSEEGIVADDYNTTTNDTNYFILSTCATLSSANTVNTLNSDVYSAGATCFTITAANVTLDCAGFNITGNNVSTYRGVAISNVVNATVKNCVISNFSCGVSIYVNSREARVYNNTIITQNYNSCNLVNGDGVGINSEGADYGTITDNTIYPHPTIGCGIGIYATAIYNNVSNNIVNLNYAGIRINGAGYENIYDNNTIYYSVYSNFLLVGATHHNYIRDNALYNATRMNIEMDNANNMTVTGNRLYNASNYGIYLYRGMNDTYDNVSNNLISNSRFGGIQLRTKNYVTVINNTITNNNTNNERGMEVTNSSYGVYKDNYIQSLYASINRGVLHIELESKNNTFSNNIINSSATGSNEASAILIEGNGSSNYFINNTLFVSSSSGTQGVNITATNGNHIFCLNNFTNINGYYVQDDNNTNFYNCTYDSKNQGNIWYNVINNSVTITGTVSSSISSLNIGDAGAGYPYNITTSLGKVTTGVTDYAPLTTLSTESICRNNFATGETYTLENNITNNGTCFSVAAQNVVIDCNGHSITGNNATGAYGVYVTNHNLTLKNCIISNYQHGIYLNNIDNNRLINSIVSTTYDYGIWFVSSDYNYLYNVTARSNNELGIYIQDSSNNIFNQSSGINYGGGQYGTRIRFESYNNTFVEFNASSLDNIAFYIDGGNNTLIDCKGITWRGVNNTGVYGIRSTQLNTTIINCKFDNFSSSIYLTNTASNSTIINNTITQTYGTSCSFSSAGCYGIYLSGTDYVTISNNIISPSNASGGGGIGLYNEANYNNITNNNITGAYYSIRIGSSNNNYLANNYILNSSYNGLYAHWVVGYNSYYNIFNNNTIYRSGSDGIYFNGAYHNTLSNNKVINSSIVGIHIGSAHNNSITNNVINDSTQYGIRIFNGADNGSTIENISNNNFTNSGFAGILLESNDYIVVNNNRISNSNVDNERGMIITNSSYNNINNNYIQTLNIWTTRGAIHINSNSASNNFSHNIINSSATGSNVASGILLEQGTRNTFVNNTIFVSSSGTTPGINISISSGNNTFCLNNFTNINYYYVSDYNGTNRYNCTYDSKNQGNIWHNIVNRSVQITGSIDSSITGLKIGTAGTGYPYNITTSLGKVTTGVTDYAPLTALTTLGCTNITTQGLYELSTNLNSVNTCFNITTPNVMLDCRGFSITGTNTTNSYGVYTNQINTTIKNCIISNYSTEIYFNGADNGLIENINVSSISDTNGHNIYLNSNANNNVLSNITAYSEKSTIINIYNSVNNNLTNIEATSDNGWIITLNNASNNNLKNINTRSNNSNIVLTTGSNNNIITNITAGTTVQIGIWITFNSNNNTITNATTTATTGYGIGIQGSSNNNILTNINTTSNSNAMHISSGNNSIINNITFISNTSTSIFIQNAINNSITNSTIISINGSKVIEISHNSTNNSFINNKIISTNKTGTLVYINETSGNNIFYWNNFTDTTGYYINGTNTTNKYNTTISGNGEGNIWYNVINSSVNIRGTINSSITGLYIGDAGTGYPYNITTSLGKVTTGVTDYAPLTIQETLMCKNIITPGTYALSININSINTCFNITAENVTIDCRGYRITGVNITNSSAIYSNKSNTTIQNCIINNYSSSIYLTNTASNSTIINNTINQTFSTSCDFSIGECYGIYLSGTDYVKILDNNIYPNNASEAAGIGIYNAANYNNITGNTITNTYRGIIIGGSNNNHIENNNIINSSGYTFYSLWVTGGGNCYNDRIINNYIYKSQSSAIHIGGGTYNYIINNNSIIDTTVMGIHVGGAYNITITNNTIINTSQYGIRLYNNASTNTIKNNNITNSEYGGIDIVNSYNISITNNNISNTNAGNDRGMRLENASDNAISGNYIQSLYASSNDGVIQLILNSVNNTFTSNIINSSATASNVSRGIHILNGSRNNFINNTIFISSSQNTPGIEINISSGNNIFCLNNFTNISYYYVKDDNTSNHYNCTYDGKNQGNIWHNVINGSVDIKGSINSTIAGLYLGDTGTGYPYNVTTSLGKVTTGVTDYAPLTIQETGSTCRNDFTSGEIYVLQNNVTSSGTCFSVTVTNVEINCNGSSITGNNATSTYGIYASALGSNLTIKNCIISNYYDGIQLSGADRSDLINITSSSTYRHGVYFLNADNCTTYNLTAISSLEVGLMVQASTINTFNESSGINSGGGQYGTRVRTDSHNNKFIGFTASSLDNTALYIDGGNNTIIDCKNRTWYGGNTSADYGVYSTQLNTTIQNCNFNNFSTSIYLTSTAGNSTINTVSIYQRYNTSCSAATGACNGIFLNGADYVTISNVNITINASNTNSMGINNYNNADYNLINNSYSYSNGGYGMYVYNSNYTSMYNITGISVLTRGIVLNYARLSNLINSNGTGIETGSGIYLSDSQDNLISHSHGRSIISGSGIHLDNSSNNNITNTTGTSDSGVGFYFTTDSNENYVLKSNATSNSSDATSFNVRSNNNYLNDSTFISTANYGVYFVNSINNTIIDSHIYSNTNYPVRIYQSNYSMIRNSTIISGTKTEILMYIAAASLYNTFCMNNFTNTSGVYINDLAGNNYYNCTYDSKNQGNIWHNIINGSVIIEGTINSSVSNLKIGSMGSGFPYNVSTSLNKVSSGVVDYAPLTLPDIIAPSVGQTSIYEGATYFNSTIYFYKGSVNISASASDTDTGINTSSCIYTKDGSNYLPATGYAGGYCYQTNINDAVNRTFNFIVHDLEGNIGTGTSRTYTYDGSSPNTTANGIVSNGSSYSFGTASESLYVNITLNCNDSNIGSGCNQTYYCTDTTNACTPSTTYSGGIIQISTVGQNYIRYYSNDYLNSTESIKNSSVIIGSICRSDFSAGETYTLTSNISNSGTCFNIGAANVVINCNGYNITGTNTTSSYGIYTNRVNVTVKNCIISNFEHGIYFYGADNGLINNVSTYTTYLYGNGIYLYTNSNYNRINNSLGASISGYGVIVYNSIYNNLSLTRGSSNSHWGIYLSECNNTLLSESNGTSSSTAGIYIYRSMYNNITNSKGISNSGEGCYLANSNYNILTKINGSSNTAAGLYLYNSSYNNVTISNGVSGSNYGIGINQLSDYNRLTYTNGSSNSSAGILLNNSLNSYLGYVIGRNIISGSLGYGIKISSGSNNTYLSMTTGSSSTTTGIFIDGGKNIYIENNASYAIIGNNLTGTYGIYSNQINTTIKDAFISNFETGILLNNSINSSVNGANITTTHTDDGYAIRLQNTSHSIIQGSILKSTRHFAAILNDSQYNNLYTNSLYGDGNYNGGLKIISELSTNISNNYISTGGLLGEGNSSGLIIENNNIRYEECPVAVSGVEKIYQTVNIEGGTHITEDFYSKGDYRGKYGVRDLTTGRYLSGTGEWVGSEIILETGVNVDYTRTTVEYVVDSSPAGLHDIQLTFYATAGESYFVDYACGSGLLSNCDFEDAGKGSPDDHVTDDFGSWTIETDTAIFDSTEEYHHGSFALKIMGGLGGGSEENGINCMLNATLDLEHVESSIIKNNSLVSIPGDTNLAHINVLSTNNTFYWNNFTDTTGYYIINNASNNKFNTSIHNGTTYNPAGNMWANVLNGNVVIASSVGYPSPFANLYYGKSGFSYPYNTSYSLNKLGGTQTTTDYGPLTYLISNCADVILYIPNSVVNLTENLTINSSTCLIVQAENITIDCKNYGIIGNNAGASTYGIHTNKFNTTIRNCDIRQFTYAQIAYITASNGTIINTNVSSTGNGMGIYLYTNSSYNTISSVNATTNIASAIAVNTNCNYTIINNSYGKSASSNGIIFSTSGNNSIINSTGKSEGASGGAGIKAGYGSIITNSKGYANSGQGLYLESQNITINNFSGSASGTGTGIYGQANNIFINNSVGISSSGFGILIFGNNYTLNNSIGISSTLAGLDMEGNDGKVANSIALSNSSYALYLYSFRNNITNITATSNSSTAVLLYGGDNNTISNSIFTSNTSTNVMRIQSSADYNILRNITFISNNKSGTLINISSDSNTNTFCLNNFTNTSGLYVNDSNGANYYNCTVTPSCYQEFANRSNECNNLANGSYFFSTDVGSTWTNSSNCIDGNWNSNCDAYNGGTSYFYVNYSKPPNAISAIWAIRHAANISATNVIIPQSCFNNNTIRLQMTYDWITYYSMNVYAICYNSSGSEIIINSVNVTSDVYFYEESIIWTMNSTNEGNIWHNVINSSVNISGTQNSSIRGLYIGSDGSGYPYNITTSLNKVSTGVVDYAPLTTIFTPNSAPLMNLSIILPSIAYNNDTLLGYCNATDNDGNNLTYYYTWYRNNAINISSVTTNNFTQGSLANVANISSSQLIYADNWTLSCKASDGMANSSWMNSTEKYINIYPTITFVAPTDANQAKIPITRNYTYINISSNKNLTICSLNWSNTLISMSGSGTTWYYNKTDITNGIYDYYVTCNDSLNNQALTETRTILFQTPFLASWNTSKTTTGSSTATQISLPLIASGTYNFTVYWGDGNSSNITAYNQAERTYTYTNAGTYNISIVGTIIGFAFANSGDRSKIQNIYSWGQLQLGDVITGYFYGANNLTITATDILNLNGTTVLNSAFRECRSLTTIPSMNEWDVSKISDMQYMFNYATNFNQNISGWNTANVTNMQEMFRIATNFNQNLSNWNTGKVTNMYGMFWSATNFNGNISGWNTGNVTSMYSMFYNAINFNGNISGWNTGKVTDMQDMFNSATNFNQNISGWNTGNVTTMYYMFFNAINFNGNISGWNTGKVTNMQQMFRQATNFNQNISNWNTGNVTSMYFMFYGATNFNQNLSNWNTEKVTDMGSMFYQATNFNGSISNWNTANVTNMQSMFTSATKFNQNISGWNTGKVTNMYGMFQSATAFNQNISNWNTGNVTTMYQMFASATNFNGNISGWNTGNVTNMIGMFQSATNFNQPIGNWDTSKVTNMSGTFQDATNFNQNISGWNTGNVTNMQQMFYLATSFEQNIGSWDVRNVTSMTAMFNSVTLDTSNYDAILNGWASQIVKNSVSFSGGNSKYSYIGKPGRETLNTTYLWTITDGGLYNSIPIIVSSRITPTIAYTNESLIGYCNATDNDGTNLTYYYIWHLNNAINISSVTTNNFTQGTEINVANMTNTSLAVGQNWTFSCKATDRTANSSWMNSTSVTIIPLIPQIPTLISPTNNNYTLHDRTPTFVWTTSSLASYYEINITSNHCVGISDNDTTIGVTESNYTPSSELNLEYECTGSSYYNWTVRACNIQACSNYSTKWNFSIEPYLVITLINNTVTFPSLPPDAIFNTTNTSMTPFVFQNDGNINSNLTNVTINQSMWNVSSAQLGTRYLQIMAEENESGSLNITASQTAWQYAHRVNNNTIIEFEYADNSDSANIHVLLEVPNQEPSGSKSTYMTFHWI
ncbi:MAG: BspA family leucine-rich repeat surface protein [Candidatus Woesearchaeota archaeon]